MKKFIVLTCIGLLSIVAVQAQEFKLAKSSGKLVINLGSVTVEGYSGNEIVFSTAKENHEEDERAKGLRPISGSGFVDNTGLGISVVEKDGKIEVNQVTQRNAQIKVMVPKGVSVSYSFSKAVNAGPVVFKDVDSEIDISVQHNKVTLENITGPATIKAVYSEVNAKFKDNVKGPISIASIYGHVDVALPVNTKANLAMKTSYGEILAAPDFKIDLDKNNGDMVSYSNNVKGKLNGGGIDISLVSNYGKIYLRKSN